VDAQVRHMVEENCTLQVMQRLFCQVAAPTERTSAARRKSGIRIDAFIINIISLPASHKSNYHHTASFQPWMKMLSSSYTSFSSFDMKCRKFLLYKYNNFR
jgi:hypothetical protein